MFATRTSYPKLRLKSNPGSKTVPIYIKAYDDNGEPYLENHGEKNIYDVVQAHYDDTRIQSIVARFEAGDKTVLGKLQGYYADLTQSAKNLQEAQNAAIKVQAMYDRLPADVKKKYTDVTAFVRGLGSDEMKDLLLPKDPVKADVPKPVETPKEVNANVTVTE